MGRPVNKHLLAEIVATAKIGTGAAGNATFVRQKGEKTFLVTVGGVTGRATLVNKAPSAVAAGEIVLQAKNADGDTLNVVKLYNKTAILSDGSRAAWGTAAAVDAKVQVVAPAAPAPVITITTQPANQTVADGAHANLSVVAGVTQGATLTYQWQAAAAGAPASAFGDISGATQMTYATAALSHASDDQKQYRVVVSATGATSVTSSVAVVTVSA